MAYVFGPVASRRLGRSLGIDPIPFKTCNWNCVYCQLGRTAPLRSERREYAPVDEIIREAAAALRQTGRRAPPDWVSFVGSGEPTLHSGIGCLIRRVKALTATPVAIITNGSLLCLPEVREELAAADAVLPSLDAGTARLYQAINRPHPWFAFDRLVEGLREFRQGYHGLLWIEVMLVRKLNDSREALYALAAALSRIQPDEVHLSLPLRPPAEPWVEPAGAAALARARAVLGGIARVLPPLPRGIEFTASDDLGNAVLEVISRHPMEEQDLLQTIEEAGGVDARQVLEILRAQGRVHVVRHFGMRFWTSRAARARGGG